MILYRPVGQKEKELIEQSDFTKFPPRLEWQPIFYPVLNQRYAEEIAGKWNTKDPDSGYRGYVTRFEIDNDYIAAFDVQTVGLAYHQELWIPAEELENFNRHILGKIEIIKNVTPNHYTGGTTMNTQTKWNGKNKAITFSFDDGVTQDIRLVEMFNKYGLKCTFNLNSDLLSRDGSLERNGRTVRHDKVAVSDVARVYAGHEVAVHTLTHPILPTLDEEEIVRQVECDRLALSEMVGYEVVGMAYPGGGVNNDDRVAAIIKARTGVRYARTITSTNSFDEQENLYRFNPSVHFAAQDLEELVDRFLALETDIPQLLYIWGHSYEMDAQYISWETFKRICQKLAGHEDIFYGTNKEVLLDL